MYTSFCDAYEAAGKDLDLLGQTYMAPYSPSYLPAEDRAKEAEREKLLRQKTEENTKLWQAMQVFMDQAEQDGSAWDYKPHYHGYYVRNGLHTGSVSTANKQVLKEVWLLWKGKKQTDRRK